jgi:hypothetical protein
MITVSRKPHGTIGDGNYYSLHKHYTSHHQNPKTHKQHYQ